MKIKDARYLGSGTTAAELPGPALPEIAFAGRSNVGKSSLLNGLVARRSLARVSKTPGHTNKINLFEIHGDAGDLVFADLPGYGFAARSKQQVKSWGPMIEGYLLGRGALRALALLVDVRRGIEDDDLELVEFWAQTKKPLVLVATKIDKLPKSQHKPVFDKLRASARELVPGVKIVGCSGETGQGLEELWIALLGVIRA